tara:strand:- start:559 stop:762 length:204 start_codon:yes stop_codon:yes gene_type:complete
MRVLGERGPPQQGIVAALAAQHVVAALAQDRVHAVRAEDPVAEPRAGLVPVRASARHGAVLGRDVNH